MRLASSFAVGALLSLLLASCVSAPHPEVVLAAGQAGPASLVYGAEAGALFWANTNAGEIMRLDLDGGASRVVLSGLSSPRALSVGSNLVAWEDPSTSTMMSAPLSGGGATPVAPSQSNARVSLIAGGFLYWGGASLHRASLSNGETELLESFATPCELASDASFLYVLECAGTLRRAPLSGGPGEVLATQVAGPLGLTVHDGYAYWVTHWGRVDRVPVTGGPAEHLAVDEKYPRSVALGDGAVYWAAGGEGGKEGMIRSVRPGGKPWTVSGGLAFPSELVTAGGGLYWLDRAAGTLSVVSLRPDGGYGG